MGLSDEHDSCVVWFISFPRVFYDFWYLWIWHTNCVVDTRQDTPHDVRPKWIKSMMILSLDGSNRLWTLRPTERIRALVPRSVHWFIPFSSIWRGLHTTCHFFYLLWLFLFVFITRLRGVVERWRSPIKMAKYYEKQTFCPHQGRLVRSWHLIFARRSLCVAKRRQTSRTFFFLKNFR